MSYNEEELGDIVPAHLHFLAIFNPELGQTEETEKQQILFYWSKSLKSRKRAEAGTSHDSDNYGHQQNHERMRQVGLAQGMVNFARTFSGYSNLDTIDTESHRIVLKQLEEGWWILASICLTRIPNSFVSHNEASKKPQCVSFEYSSKEVSPHTLLIEQLLRAQRIFILHHGSSLKGLYSRIGRFKLCATLDGYWPKFARGWNVMLSGNPAADAYGAIKLAGAGELGVGVGEEEWGSGEREVLEGLVRSTEGLTDLLVMRTNTSYDQRTIDSDEKAQALGGDLADGIIFTGVGRLSRLSACALSEWMQHVARHGHRAYGVQDNPGSTRPRLRNMVPSRKTHMSQMSDEGDEIISTQGEGKNPSNNAGAPIPPSIMSVVEASLDRATTSARVKTETEGNKEKNSSVLVSDSNHRTQAPAKWTKYLKFGYGSTWGRSGESDYDKELEGGNSNSKDLSGQSSKSDPSAAVNASNKNQTGKSNTGRFLIGLNGDLDGMRLTTTQNDEADPESIPSGRLSIRTIHVEIQQKNQDTPANDQVSPTSTSSNSSDNYFRNRRPQSKMTRLRVILYEDHPFIYALLFEPSTYSLSAVAFYESLHKCFSALRKPLEESTAPERMIARLAWVMTRNESQNQLRDLVYDPINVTVRSSIPNIPAAWNSTLDLASAFPQWTRLEALNVHAQILATITESRKNLSYREISIKTQRSWWINYIRVRSNLTSANQSSPFVKEQEKSPDREVFVIRKAMSEVEAQSGHKKSGSLGRLPFSSSANVMGLNKFISEEKNIPDSNDKYPETTSSWSAGKMIEGIGVDPKKYVETLFSLNR